MTSEQLSAMPQGTLIYHTEQAGTMEVYNLIGPVPGCPSYFCFQRIKKGVLTPVVFGAGKLTYKDYGATPDEAVMNLERMLSGELIQIRGLLGIKSDEVVHSN